MTNLPQPAQQIISTLTKAGFEAYAVGGSVRDILMGKVTHGWDFTTKAKPEEILKLFPESFYDNQFGTVGIKIKSEKNPEITEDVYEVTTYRSEKGYTDHRHPDKIQWGKTIEEDLSRRDFTINAIAFDGKNFIDPFEGRKDIEKKIIRCVGDPDARLKEDALRMMRAVRIASELGFFITDDTVSAIKKNVGLLSTISAERIRDELLKLLASGYPADGILLLRNSGILEKILPEVDAAFGVPQKSPKRHHIYDVGTHSVMAVKFCPSNDPIVRLATLLHDVGKPKTFQKDDKTQIITFYNHEVAGANIAYNIARRLRMSKKQTERLGTLVRWHQFTVDERQTDSAIRRFIRRVGKENLDDILALRIGDRLGGGALETSWRLELFKKRLEEVQKQPFAVADLAVDGNDVMAEFACKPGPVVGKILQQLFSVVETGSVANERETLLAKLKEMKIQFVSS